MAGFLEKLFRGVWGLTPSPLVWHVDNRGLGCALAQLGGNWTNGSNAGPFYWNLGSSSADAAGNIGGRLVRKAG